MRQLDIQIFDWFYAFAHRSPFLDGAIVFFAEYLIWLTVIWVVWLLLRKRDWRNDWPAWKNRFQCFALGLVAVIISRGILATLISYLVDSARPFVALGLTSLVNHDVTNSFPSGHISSMVPIVLTLYLFNKRAGRWGIFTVVLVGAGRVAAGLHWPSD